MVPLGILEHETFMYPSSADGPTNRFALWASNTARQARQMLWWHRWIEYSTVTGSTNSPVHVRNLGLVICKDGVLEGGLGVSS